MTDVCLLNLALSDSILAVSLPLWVYSSQNTATCKLITGVYQVGFLHPMYYVSRNNDKICLVLIFNTPNQAVLL